MLYIIDENGSFVNIDGARKLYVARDKSDGLTYHIYAQFDKSQTISLAHFSTWDDATETLHELMEYLLEYAHRIQGLIDVFDIRNCMLSKEE